MRKSSLLFLSGLFLGFALYVERNNYDPQIGDDSQKGPPGIMTVDLADLNAIDRTIANDGTGNNIISSMQMGKGSTNELSDDVENGTISHIKKQNQSVGYKTNDPDIIIKKNEFNQI